MSKELEQHKLIFAIAQLKKLDLVLQSKVIALETMNSQVTNPEQASHLNSKISGVKIAREEIRRDIKDLQEQLCN